MASKLYVTVTGSNQKSVQVTGHKFIVAVPCEMIQNKVGEKVQSGTVEVNDKILIEHDASYRILSATLIKPTGPIKKMPSNPINNPPVSVNPFGSPPHCPINPYEISERRDQRSHSLFTPANEFVQAYSEQISINLYEIGLIDSISSLQLSENSKRSLHCYFESFRWVPIGPNNMILTLGVAIIDHSLIYSTPALLNKLKSLIEENPEHVMPGSENVLNILNHVYFALNQPITIRNKLKAVEEIYSQFSEDLIKLIRNCMKISACLLYNTKKYQHFSYIRELNDLVSLAENQLSTFELHDYQFLLDYLDLNIRKTDGNSLTVTAISSGVSHVINILENENGYCPLYTIEESSLYKLGIKEYDEMIIFVKAYNRNNDRESEIATERVKNDINLLKKNNKEMSQIFSVLYQTENKNLQGILDDFQMEDREILEDIVKESSCSKCKVITQVADLMCGHYLCKTCVYECYSHEFIRCSLCAIRSDNQVIAGFIGSN